MEESCFPQWADLCDDLKLQIISKMDCETRRLLRSCSRKDKQLVERLPWRKEMELYCKFCSRTGRWFCTYYRTNKYHQKKALIENFFETFEEANVFMKELVRTAETVYSLSIQSTLNSRVILSDSRRLKNVSSLTWGFIGGENSKSRLDCYSFLFNQINLSCLEFLYIDLDTVKNNDPMQNDGLFELERTQMNLDTFHFSGLINDEQFSNTRANIVHLNNCSLISPSAFVKFIQKLILQKSSRSHYEMTNFSSELQFYLFGALRLDYENSFVSFLLNLAGSDLKLKISFFLQEHPENDDDDDYDLQDDDDYDPHFYLYGVDIWIDPLHLFDEPNVYRANTESLEDCPSFHRFISDISKGLPSGFPLMCDSRNL